MFIVTLIVIDTAHSDWSQEKAKIEYLLIKIESSQEVRFIRNGTEHTGKEASSHLRLKLEKSQKSFFAPDENKWTAEMFIDKVASKSSISGDVYKIKKSDGTVVLAADWMRQQLRRMVKVESSAESAQTK